MKRILLIIIIASVISSVFGDGSKVYNGTDSLSSISTPSLSVTLSSEGYTLGLGFSSTNPASEGITNISEMPLRITPTLNSSAGSIQLIGSGEFYIWWQIQKPIEKDKTRYTFSVKKSGKLGNGIYSVDYVAMITNRSENIGETATELDSYDNYDSSSIHENSWKIEVSTSDASGVPYGTVLTSAIILEVQSK